jgi:uncharacterized protein (TIGR02444 family)
LTSEAPPTQEALWPFALEVYGRPGVEAVMLELQDAHGQCVPYLLWALWLARSGRPAGRETLLAGAVLARSWQDVAVAPLRQIRRRLRTPLQPIRAADQRRLRERVKSLELDAERMLLRMLEAASPPPGGAAADPSASLDAAIAAWGGTAPAALVTRLASLAG